MPLDFGSATNLFMGTEEELARALGIERGDLRRYRQQPHSVPGDLLDRLGDVLIERGWGMRRVGELLKEAEE